MKLTVIICTHNRAELLMRTISSLNQAGLPKQNQIEILVIANACADDTVLRLKEYQSMGNKNNRLALNFSEEPKPGKSYALNRAINLLDSELCCFIDDDHRVDKNYFLEIFAALKRYPEVSIYCGQIIPDWTGEEPEWIHEQGKYRIYPLPVPHFQMGTESIPLTQNSRLPGGGNLIVKKAVFAKSGNFSIALGPKGHNLSGSEDSEFVLRTLACGYAIQYIPEIIQYHYVDLERLEMRYLVLKSFQRTRTMTLARNPQRTFGPMYLWRKLLICLFCIILAFNLRKFRFYLMRFAATLGEMIGYWNQRK